MKSSVRSPSTACVDMIIQAFHEERSVNDITFTVKRGDLDTARKALDEAAEHWAEGPR